MSIVNNANAKTERMKAAEADKPVSASSIATLKEAINIIKSEYVTPVSESKLVESAINGMLVSLDPHSNFYNKESLNQITVYNSSVESGVGLEIAIDNGVVKVVTPIDGGPAEKAGIKAGDHILTVDGISVHGLSVYEVMQRMAGLPKSDIKITVFREGAFPSLTFKLKRENVIVSPAVVEYIDKNIVYIRLSSFDLGTYASIEEHLRKIMKKNPPIGIVLDLRNNPGGLITEAVKISSMFIEKGTIVYTRGRDDSTMAEYNCDTSVFRIKNTPVVALINNGTASAAEIVAGALQDNKKAVILGTRSFGKGSVQDIIPLEENAAISLTTSLYYTPTGRSIQAEGVVPDIIIEDIEVKKFKDNASFREENIEGHLESVQDIKQSKASYLMEKIKKKINYNTSASCKKCRSDYMIIRAVDLVKGIGIYNMAIPKNSIRENKK